MSLLSSGIETGTPEEDKAVFRLTFVGTTVHSPEKRSLFPW